MAGSKVAVLEEIRARLQASITSGSLSAVKRLKVGASEEMHGGPSNMPYINLNLISGTEEANNPNNMYRDDMNIEVVIVCEKCTNDYNKIYVLAEETGPVYLLEAVLNVLDLNVSEAIDNTFAGSVQYLKSFSYTADYSKDTVVFRISINLRTAEFRAGGR